MLDRIDLIQLVIALLLQHCDIDPTLFCGLPTIGFTHIESRDLIPKSKLPFVHSSKSRGRRGRPHHSRQGGKGYRQFNQGHYNHPHYNPHFAPQPHFGRRSGYYNRNNCNKHTAQLPWYSRNNQATRNHPAPPAPVPSSPPVDPTPALESVELEAPVENSAEYDATLAARQALFSSPRHANPRGRHSDSDSEDEMHT
ncbi:hypothetical protein ABBQ32_007085 [Trebouxia sp. C0010 RCD-2024]